LAFLHDLLWIPLVIGIAYGLRFNFEPIPTVHVSGLLLFILVGVPIQGIAYRIFGLYKGMWRFASIPDIFRIFKAVFIGALVITMILAVTTRLSGVPRSVLFLYPFLLISALSLSRLAYRWYKDRHFSIRQEMGSNVIIVGAGQAGELLLRDLRNQDRYHVVGFLDDDNGKTGRDIHGTPIFGGIDMLAKMVREYELNEAIIAIPSASGNEMQRIMRICSHCSVSVRVLPPLLEMGEYRTIGSQLRSLSIEDLLGREQITLDLKAIKSYLNEKSVMVTGAGGSIGSELCRQIGALNPDKIILFDHGEFNLYTIEHDMRAAFPTLELIVILGDVKNHELVEWVFETYRPQVIFHAAAYKHVPMLELNPAEGVKNNVGGTKTMAQIAANFNAEKFVLVSTDKAVNPTSVMGATKRIAELFCQNLNGRNHTRFITTRFGNVLGSAGSVVPLFQKQIKAGGPVTVTHPEIKRYFMTIPESVSLILQAGAMGNGGEIFVLDMGELVLIKDLADQMIRLSGLEPGKDVEITFTGLRPGEKLYEELLHENEGLLNTDHPKLLLAKSREVEWNWLIGELDALNHAAIDRDIHSIERYLKSVVPEYTDQLVNRETGERVSP
jgi:FlaA1/EpsC-like NDP-sugar epimerase